MTLNLYQLSTTSFLLLALLPLGASPGAAQSIVPANDGTGTVVTPNRDHLTITGGVQVDGNLFHSFQQFGLSSGQVANFLATPELHNILGRVVGGDPSVINGVIQVTGGAPNLYLLNPAGIIFGQSARLDVPASFTATTATGVGFGPDQWWSIASPQANYATLVGNPTAFRFDSSLPASLVNTGSLSVSEGQSLNLLGNTVVNTGSLSAPGGSITIAAVPGSSLVRLSQPGSFLSLDVDPVASRTLAPLSSPATLPQLLTGGGMTVNNATGLSVDATGVVRLTHSGAALPTEAGTAIVSGTISVASAIPSNSATPPNVTILGDRVGLLSATIDASALGGGGTVLIGGDYKGQGTIPNARITGIDASSTIQANALGAGQGGKVIVWADQTTRFDGTIAAQGGIAGGNGGFVEVSGKDTLRFIGFVDTSAPLGQSGTLLLDPTTITVVGSTAVPGNAVDGFWTAAEDPGNQTIGVDAIRTLLTSGSLILEASDTIDWAGGSNLDYNGIGLGKTLELRAGGGIFFSGTIADSAPSADSLNVLLNADADGTANGDINLFSGAAIATGGGNLTLNANNAGSIAIWVRGGVTLNSNGGALQMTGTTADSGNRAILNQGDLLSAGGAITLNGVNTGGGVGGGQGLWLQGTIASAGGAVNLTGSQASTFGQGILVQGTITAGSGNVTLVGNQAGNDDGIRVDNSITTTTGTIRLDGTSNGGTGVNQGGALTSNGGAIQLLGTANSGNTAVSSTGGITSNGGAITIEGNRTNAAGGGSAVTLGNTLNSNGGNIAITGSHAGSGRGIENSATITSGSGTITFTIPDAGGDGIWFRDGGVTSTGGAIQVTSTTRNGSDSAIIAQRNLSSGGGAITFTATNTGDGGGAGIRIAPGVTVDSNGGTLAFTGSHSGDFGGRGIDIVGTVTSGAGDLTLTGSGKTGSAVDVSGAVTSSTGAIAVNGTNTVQGNAIALGGTITTGTGSITLQGNNNDFGSAIDMSGSLASSGGAITLLGNTLNGGNRAINTANSGTITSGGGDITIQGAVGVGGGFTAMRLGSAINSGGGNVTITGSHASAGAGVLLPSNIAAGAGTITVTGTSVDGDGIAHEFGTLSTTTGSVIFNGTSTNGAGIQQFGVITTGGGGIALTGNSAGNNAAINATFGASLASNGGPITLTGTNTGNGSGVALSPPVTAIDSGTGSLTISGRSDGNGIGVDNQATLTGRNVAITGNSFSNNGVWLRDGSVSSTGGTLQITGTTANSNSTAVLISRQVASNGGDMTIAGTNQGLGGAGSGVTIQGVDINSNGGSLAITGSHAGSGPGLQINGGSTIFSGAGTQTLMGTSATGRGVSNDGQLIANGGAIQVSGSTAGNEAGVANNGAITSNGGAIVLTGTNTNLGGGVGVGLGNTTISSGEGSLTITGSQAGNGQGVYSEATISSLGGNITVNGSSSSSDGIWLRLNGGINSIAGSIAVNGSTDSGNQGIIIQDRTINSNGGNISFTGTNNRATGGEGGVRITGGAVTSSLGNIEFTGVTPNSTTLAGINLGFGVTVQSNVGDITLTADRNDVAGVNEFRSTGNLTVQPLNTNAAMAVAANSGDAAANFLTIGELAKFTDGFSSLIIGRSDSTGPVTMNAYTFADSVVVRTPGVGSSGISIVGSPNLANNNLTLNSGGTVTQTVPIVNANGLVLLGSGEFILTDPNNAVNNLAGNTTNNASYRDVDGLAIFTVNGVSGFTTTGNLALYTNGNVTQPQQIVADGLALLGNGFYILGNAANDINTLAISNNDTVQEVRDANNLVVGSVFTNGFGTTTGITTSNDFVGLRTAGNLTINQAINVGNSDVSLTVDGTATQGALGTVTASNLELLGAGSFTLTNPSNNVFDLVGNTTGAIRYVDADALIIDFFNATQGITTANNPIEVATVNGPLTVFNAAAGADVNAGTSTVTLRAGGLNQLLTIVGNAQVVGTGGVTLIGDSLSLDGSVNAGTAIATLRQSTNGQLIDLGGADVPGTLGITDAELDRVTAGIIRVGDANSGSLALTTPIIPAGSNTLSLQTGTTITQTPGSTLTVNNLALQAVGAVTLTEANAINTLAANTTGPITVTTANALDVGTVDGISGITTTGDLTLTTGGNLTDSSALSIAGTTTLTTGSNTIVLDVATNDFNRVAITNAGNTTLVDANALDLGNASVTGNLTITTNGNLTDSGAVNVTGTTSLNTTGNTITLDNTGNDFTTLTIANTANATVVDANALNFAAITLTGNLEVLAGGLLTQTPGSSINVPGIARFTTTHNAGNVTVREDNDTLLGNSTIGGDFTLTSAGDVSQVAGTALKVAGTTTINTPGTVTLTNPNNVLPTTTLANGDVIVSQVGLVNLPAQTVTGNLTVISKATGEQFAGVIGGDAIVLTNAGNSFGQLDLNTANTGLTTVTGTPGITQSGIQTVAGTTTLNATAAGTIALTLDNQFTGAVSVVAGNDVSLTNGTDLALGNSTISGNLTAIATTGNLTDTGMVTVDGNASFTTTQADADITLDQTTPGGTIALNTTGSTGNATLTTATGINLANSTVGGILAVTTGGAITDSGNVLVTGLTSLNAGGNDITLDNANDFSTVTISNANSVTLNDINALDLGTSTITGPLTLTTAGPITDSGNVVVSGLTSLNAGGNDITLDNANNFGTVAISSANAVILNDINALDLGDSTITGPLTLTTAGPITDSGNVVVSGLTSLNAGGNTITLDNANDFGTVAISNANGVILNDINALDLGDSTITGPLTLTTAGPITDSGNVVVSGLTSLNAGGNTITLDNANDFGTVAISNANGVILNDINALDLGDSTITGPLTLTTAGPITDSGTVVVSGLTSLNAGGNTITLDNANDFGTVAISNANGVILNDINALDLGTSTITGPLTLTTAGSITDSGTVAVTGLTSLNAGGNDITLDNANDFGTVAISNANGVILNDVNALDLGNVTITGPLTLTTAGPITDSGTVVVAGTTTLNSGVNDITLDSAGNDFSTVAIAASNNVSLVDQNALTLAAFPASLPGDVTIQAGDTTVTGAIVTLGNQRFTTTTLTLDAGLTGNQVSLFNSGLVSGPGTITATTLTLNGSGDVGTTANRINTQAGTIALATTADANLNQTGAVLLQGNSSGNVDLLGTGTIGQGAVLTLGGNLTLATTLANTGNVSVTNSGSTVLGNSTIGGNFALTSTGAITQAPGTSLKVAGDATFTTPASVTLGNSGNVLPDLTLPSGDVIITRVGTVNLPTRTIAGNLTVNSQGTGEQFGGVFGGDAIVLTNAGNSFGGQLSVTTANAGLTTVTGTPGITQSGIQTVAGTTTLSATAAGTIALTLDNQFTGAVSVVAGNNVSLTNAANFALGNSAISGNLTATATAGNLTDTGTVTVNGNASFTTTQADADITLDQTTPGGTIALNTTGSTGNATLTTATGVNLANSTVGGILAVTTGGAITDSGNVAVMGLTSLNAGGNDITLDNANDLGTVAISNANAVVLNDINALDLGNIMIAGPLTVTTAGTVTNSGAVVVAGLSTFNTGTGDLTLTNAGNDFTTVAITTSNNATLADLNALTLATAMVNGALTVTSGGTLTQDGALTVTGNTTLDAGNNAVISNAGITSGSLALTGGAITLNNPITSTGDVTITNSGLLTIAAPADIASTGAFLQNGTGAVATAGDITNAASITLTGATTLTGPVALSTSNGDIQFQSTVDGNQALTLTAGSGAITMLGAVGSSQSLGDVQVNSTGTTRFNGTVQANRLTTDAGGTTVLNGNVTTIAAQTYGDRVLIDNDITLGSTNSPISLLSTLDSSGSPHSLTVNAGLGAVTLGGSVGNTTGLDNLSITTGAALSQNGAWIVGGVTNLDTNGQDITLTNAANDFGTVRVLSANTVRLRDANDVTLGTFPATLPGDVAVQAGGGITTIAPITTTGNQTYTSSTLTLGSTLTADTLTLNNSGLVSGPGTLAAITLALNGSGDIGTSINRVNTSVGTIAFNTTAAELFLQQAGTVALQGTATGNVNLATNSTITQGTAPLTIAGDVTLTTTVTTGGSVSLRNAAAGGTAFGDSQIGGNLALISTGPVNSTAGSLQVAGTTAITSSGAVLVPDGDDVLGGGVTTTIGNDVTISRVGVVDLRSALLPDQIAGNLTVNSYAEGLVFTGTVTPGDAIVLMDASNSFGGTLRLNTPFVGMVTSVTNAPSGITQSTAVTMTNPASTASFNAVQSAKNSTPAGTIVLTDANNQLGALTLQGTTVALRESAPTVLNGGTVSGNLTVQTDVGGISDSGTLTVVGVANFTTTEVDADITLTQLQAGSLGVTTSGTGGNATVTSASGLNLATSTVGGALTVTANGTITSNGPLTIAGTTQLNATGNDITLTQANDFATLIITTAKDVIVIDTTALDLGPSTIGGNLTVTTAGDITNSGALTVNGTTTLAAGTSSILLDNANNDFASIAINSAQDATVVDRSAISLGTVSLGNDFTLQASGPITQVPGSSLIIPGSTNLRTTHAAGDVSLASSGATQLGDTVIGGNIDIATTGALSQSAGTSFKVAGGLTVNTPSSVILDNTGNVLPDLTLPNGDVIITRVGLIDLTARTVTGSLSVNSQSTGEQFNGILGGTAIVLDQPNNRFGGPISINTANAGTTVLPSATPGITQSGALTVNGTVALNATPAGNITLTLDNAFNTVQITGGNTVTIANTQALTLDASTISNNLTLSTLGDISQRGPLSVGNTATFDAGRGSISLTNTANQFGTVQLNGTNATLVQAGNAVLGASTLLGDLALTTPTGTLTIAAPVTAENITLTATGITLDAPLAGSGELTLQPVDPASDVGIGRTTGGFDLTTTSLGNLVDGFSTIVIGRSDSTGIVQLDPVVFADSVTIAGGSELVGPNGATTWVFTGSDRGHLNSRFPNGLSFANIQNITAGNGDDTFVFVDGTALSGILDGGDGFDRLDYRGYTASVIVDLANNTATATGGIRNIERLTGGQGNNTLIGRNTPNTWAITSQNQGTVGGFSFEAVQNLTGGTADDRFVFADGGSIVGIVDGGPGFDTLDYLAYTTPVQVDLGNGTATGTGGVRNVEAAIVPAVPPQPASLPTEVDPPAESLTPVPRPELDDCLSPRTDGVPQADTIPLRTCQNNRLETPQPATPTSQPILQIETSSDPLAPGFSATTPDQTTHLKTAEVTPQPVIQPPQEGATMKIPTMFTPGYHSLSNTKHDLAKSDQE